MIDFISSVLLNLFLIAVLVIIARYLLIETKNKLVQAVTSLKEGWNGLSFLMKLGIGAIVIIIVFNTLRDRLG